jgi:transcriptional antiterminator RfaH
MQDLQKSWFVLYTKYKTGILVAEFLKSIDFETYVPTKFLTRQWSDRKKIIKIPLLPSMVLESIIPKNSNKVFDVSGVVRYLFVDGQKEKYAKRLMR